MKPVRAYQIGLLVGVLITAAMLAVTTRGASGVEDFGQVDLLKAACASITFDAKAQGVELSHCRQTYPPDFSPDGYAAVVHLSVNVVGYKRRGADVYMTKGLWHRDNLVLTD